jgi:outer membrane protein OmpA-like peptidoglycan-associated protein
MDNSRSKTTGRMGRVLVAGAVLWSVLGVPGMAEQLSSEQIFKALAGKPVTRSLSLGDRPAQNQDDSVFVESLRHHGNRSLSLADRNHVAAIVRDRPAVDLEIYFDYNSARISAQAIPQLNSLGTTLAAPEFKESVILIGGHTDSKGSDSYNQVLSERRAESVKRYLVEKFHLAAANLVTAGYGKQDPKNAADPYGAENRRVQIGNLNAQARR